MNNTDIEYNSVILSALFHDIGKIIQGTNYFENISKEYKAHSGCGKRLLEKLFEEKIIKEEFFNKKLIYNLIENHHDKDIQTKKDELREILHLVNLISVSDNFSSSERADIDKGKIGGNPRINALLESIFTKVFEKNVKNNFYYLITKLRNNEKLENLIPINEKDTTGIQSDYTDIMQIFIKELKNLYINHKNVFNYISAIQGLMEEYFWAIPSITIAKDNDISIYDHALTTSAIAAVLYKYHKENNTLNMDDIDNIRDSKKDKFLFITGDITGIQNFIFNIETINPKGLSKELRGRSFFVGLLGTIISLKILYELDLPPTSKIIDAGGKFIILAPNTESTKKKIKEISEIIIREVILFTGGSLIPVIDYETCFNANYFKRKESDKKDNNKNNDDTENMYVLIKKLQYNMEIAKCKKLNLNYKDLYFLKAEYEKYLNNGICDSCKVHPKNGEECNICNLTKILGKLIVKKENGFINFKKIDNIIYKKIDENTFQFLGFEISFGDFCSDAFYSEKIHAEKENLAKTRDISNYIPNIDKKEIGNKIDIQNENIDIIENSLCYYCKNKCESLQDRINIRDSGILTFQCIATHTPYNNHGIAVDHLALLKGDVDNLGIIFSNGLGENLILSRYISLSRMINLFFSYYLKFLLYKEFPYIYTVYAGGDDFLLIGPWEQIIEAVLKIREEFQKYVSYNSQLHFSAAINIFRPKEPVLEAAERADELLDEAKDSGKNKISIFGETNYWDDMQKIIDLKDKLQQYIADGKLNNSALYRFLKYKNLYDLYKQEEKIEYLKYDYLFSYDIRRNLKIDDDDVFSEFLNNLKKESLKILKIPLYWVIYKNRK